MQLAEIYKMYPKNSDCISLLEKIRWDNLPKCPYCKSSNYTTIKNNRYHCNNCYTSYSVTVGTFLHKTKIDLQKWFYVICQDDLNLSIRKLSKDLNVNKNTADRILRKIKYLNIQDVYLNNNICKEIQKNEYKNTSSHTSR